MRPLSSLASRDRLALIAGLTGPLAMCAVLVPFRGSFPNTDAALVLVAVTVAVAAFGNRLGGALAALSAGIWFDFFLTKPYDRFAISSRTDIETTVLLVGVGVAVTELAVWGRRQHQRAAETDGYLAGLTATANSVTTDGSPTRLVQRVSQELTRVLNLQSCRFHFGSGVGNPRLRNDGSLSWGTSAWDVDAEGLPPGVETELIVASGDGFHGRFLMTPKPGSRITLTQRLVAVTLADQVGAALATYQPATDEAALTS